jgi:hypothetical protein
MQPSTPPGASVTVGLTVVDRDGAAAGTVTALQMPAS